MLSYFLICLTLVTGTFVQENSPTVEVTGRVVYEDTGQAATRPGALANAMNKATREQGTGITLSANDRKEIDIRLP